jgi:hypothetical protein
MKVSKDGGVAQKQCLARDSIAGDDLGFESETAGAFLSTLFLQPGMPKGLIEIAYEVRHRETAKWMLTGHARFPNTAEGIGRAVEFAKAKSATGSRIYFGAGLRRPGMQPGDRSKNADIIAWPAAVFDFDSEEEARFGLDKAKELGLRFHIVVQTGAIRDGGKPDLRIQCWCRLDTPCMDLPRVSALLKAGIALLRSDKNVHDARRIMRLPGSVAWARKSGRVDEPTRLHDAGTPDAPPYTLDALEALLPCVQAPPSTRKRATSAVKSTAPAAREANVPMQPAIGSEAASIWRDAPAAHEHLQAFHDDVDMHNSAKELAFMAARRGHEADAIYAGLDGLLAASEIWRSRPDRALELRGGELRKLAEAAVSVCGGGWAPPEQEFANAPQVGDVPLDPRRRLLAETVWIEDNEQYFDLRDGKLLTRKQLNVRHALVGPPTDSRRCAEAIFLREPDEEDPLQPGRRKSAQRLTYRPGQPVQTYGEDGAREINLWRASSLEPAMGVSDDDVRPWTDVVRHVCGEHAAHVLDYLAHLLQRQGVKINHALLVKSIQGTGKSTMLTPVLEALGRHNCNIIGPAQIVSEFNDWLVARQLIIVEEMQHFEQKSTMNTIKSYLVDNPSTVLVNPKGKTAYAIPNVAAFIFFSNLDIPVKLEASDRRFFVIDSQAGPLPPELAEGVHAFYRGSGAAKVAGWLLARDISSFDPFGPAPMTDGKRALLEAGKAPFVAWLDELLSAPSCPVLLCGEDLRRKMLRELGLRDAVCTPQRFALLLRSRGLKAPYPDKIDFSIRPDGIDPTITRARIYSTRDHDVFAALVAEKGRAAIFQAFLEIQTQAHATTRESDLALFGRA